MGIPKFLRWLSERYPCISQVINDDQIPVFDNLYLDMNGIIHNCSHGNSTDPNFQVTEETIFNDSMAYIDYIFEIIKPQKVFYMAIDGVAPRAKMNQQRARRFKTALEAEELRAKATAEGVQLTGERFDSNCITPGTPFMARLSAQLKYFVNLKVTTDARWQGVKVIFSGHETPGEGEHKIMDYIRKQRSLDTWNPNTRHCLYGLDADLIVLGLLTHEPHFSLLREEVTFGNSKSKRVLADAKKVNFNLLHLSLVREYTMVEFATEQSIDFERVLDDWVLICYLVGNDFIPHLPNLHINTGALDLLFDTYKTLLMDEAEPRYLNDAGHLELSNFQDYMRMLTQHDTETCQQVGADMAYLSSKMATANLDYTSAVSTEESDTDSDSKAVAKGKGEAVTEESAVDADGFLMVKSKPRKYKPIKTDDSNDTSDEKLLAAWKDNYYAEKFGVEARDRDFKQRIVFEYIHALQWVLHYYYDGICSWDWFYPFHYSPFISTITEYDITAMDVDTFHKGKPFLPFEQLMGVLPPASHKHVPVAYQHLMLNESSPIHDFYPLTFESDLNGKKHDWEAVVKLPFVDEARLKAAMAPHRSELSPIEEANQKQGPELIFVYSEHDPKFYTSPWPEVYPHIPQCYCHQSDMKQIDPVLVKGILPGVKMDGLWGFPTLSNVPHTAALTDEIKPLVFQQPSRNQHCIAITLKENHVTQFSTAQDAANEYLGKTVYYGWPHLKHGLVTKVSDNKIYLELGGNVDKALQNGTVHKLPKQTRTNNDYESTEHRRISQETKNNYRNRMAIKVLDAAVVLYVRQSEGLEYVVVDKKVVMATKFLPEATPSLVQCVVADEQPFLRQVLSLKDHYPLDSDVFLVGKRYYGHVAKVKAVTGGNLDVEVQFLPNNLNLRAEAGKAQSEEKYFEDMQLCRMFNIPARVVSQLLSSCQIEMPGADNGKSHRNSQYVDAGLNMKYQKKNMQVMGYSRRIGERQWEYSQAAVDVMKAYKKEFPEVLTALTNSQGHDRVSWKALYPGTDPKEARKKIEHIRKWVREQPVSAATAVTCGSQYLSTASIKALLDTQDTYNTAHAQKQATKTVSGVTPNELFQPIDSPVAVDLSADFYTGDRIVCTLKAGTIPYLLCGTVVSVYGKGADLIDVVMDSNFIGGGSLGGRCPPGRGKSIKSAGFLNITYGERKQGNQGVSASHPNRQHNTRQQHVVTSGRRQSQLSHHPQHHPQQHTSNRNSGHPKPSQPSQQPRVWGNQHHSGQLHGEAPSHGRGRGVKPQGTHQPQIMTRPPQGLPEQHQQQPKLAKASKTTPVRNIPTQAVKKKSANRRKKSITDAEPQDSHTQQHAYVPKYAQPQLHARVPKHAQPQQKMNVVQGQRDGNMNLWDKLQNANTGARPVHPQQHTAQQPRPQYQQHPNQISPQHLQQMPPPVVPNGDLYGALTSMGIVAPRQSPGAPPMNNMAYAPAPTMNAPPHMTALPPQSQAPSADDPIQNFLSDLAKTNAAELRK